MPEQSIVSIEQISQFEGQDITIKGWIRNRRSSGINMRPASNLWHAPKLAEAL